MNFNIYNKVIFIDNFQFLSSSLDSLIKNLGKNDFKYLTQEFDSKVLDLVKQEVFYPYEYLSDFEKFKEKLSSKEKLHSFLIGEIICDKDYKHTVKVWNAFEMKRMKYYDDLYLKCDVLLPSDIFEKCGNNSWANYGLWFIIWVHQLSVGM